LELMSLVDLKTSQALLSLNHQQVIEVQLSAAESDILGQVTEDSLFGEATLVGAAEPDLFGNGSSLITPELSNESVVAEPIALAAHSSPGVAAHVTLPVQAQFAVLLLDNPADVAATQERLQAWVDANDLNWRVGDWTQAAGFIGSLVGGIKLILNGLVVLVAFVATLIIMNTLVISVTERLQEIGTMRAIGAQKAFVRKMILTETLILALASALVGVLLGTVALWLISINGLPAANDIIKILFGGDALYPSVSVSAVLQAVSMMTLGAVLACLYPLGIALKVSPLKAMQG
jgi:putative ABC transport system permease protein